MTLTAGSPADHAADPRSLPRPRADRSGASLRQAYDMALAGAIGALFGLLPVRGNGPGGIGPVRDALAGLIIGGSTGFFLNAWGPFRDGAWHKLARTVSWACPPPRSAERSGWCWASA